ncbi:hypothetical protein LCGC14_2172100 [marine sediment metagenome]|uniref:Uncharacterized protein n=1 Tax=marine sediment metagenome TaxID=412755 RepID=A0A0F9EBX9_9ZZZZ
MECIVCHSDDDVKHCSHLYVSDSEGAELCLCCRILVCELLRKFMSMNNRFELQLRKKLKRGGKIK